MRSVRISATCRAFRYCNGGGKADNQVCISMVRPPPTLRHRHAADEPELSTVGVWDPAETIWTGSTATTVSEPSNHRQGRQMFPPAPGQPVPGRKIPGRRIPGRPGPETADARPSPTTATAPDPLPGRLRGQPRLRVRRPRRRAAAPVPDSPVPPLRRHHHRGRGVHGTVASARRERSSG